MWHFYGDEKKMCLDRRAVLYDHNSEGNHQHHYSYHFDWLHPDLHLDKIHKCLVETQEMRRKTLKDQASTFVSCPAPETGPASWMAGSLVSRIFAHCFPYSPLGSLKTNRS